LVEQYEAHASTTRGLVLLTALAILPAGGCWVLLGDPFDGLKGKDADATDSDAGAQVDGGPDGPAPPTADDGALLSDTFDTGTALTQPAGSTFVSPDASTVQIADVRYQTPPFSVELIDLGASRPSLTHKFITSSSGSARVRVFVVSDSDKEPAEILGPTGIQLRTGTDTFLSAASLGKNGTVGTDNGYRIDYGSVTYTPGTWLELRIDWFPDYSFDTYLGDTRFAEHISYKNQAHPGSVQLWVGNGDTVPAHAYFDTVRVTTP
jgi:hypothetical protein